eukprot:497509-Amphidinium_carterae.2
MLGREVSAGDKLAPMNQCHCKSMPLVKRVGISPGKASGHNNPLGNNVPASRGGGLSEGRSVKRS